MRRISSAAVALLPLALAACVMQPAPEIATPAPDLPQAFFFQPDGGTGTALAALMPEGDPAYRALSQAALAQGPSLAEAVARIDAARAGARRAGAERLPNIGADGDVTRNRINPAQFGQAGQQGFIPREQTSYGANITASWDPDIFGRLKAEERAALARIDAASAQAQAVRLSLLAEIAASITDWRVLDARAAAISEDMRAAQQLAALAKVRENAGIAPGFDRVRAEATASSSQVRLAALDSERARLIGRLVTLTGENAASVRAALATAAPVLAPAPAPAGLPSELLANRPDVAAAAANLAASDADLAAAARARFPRITLSGVIGLLAFDPEDFFNDSIIGTLTAGIAGPLLDFGRVGAGIDLAAADKRAAFAAYRGAVFTALGDAEAAYGVVAAADAEAQLSVNERDQLTRAASLAETRYRAGLASFLEVLEARRAADSSGERAAAALGRAARARIVLWQALGGEVMASAATVD
ncbi:efflux transporter outer membrane subunit [Porphyrobacter sp. ULC335]|uniref:efflux transporter outer membrane subunit n=1 Tax=Porphyrobacter sp. ULC335 TaxID=2854260 RepID=UPI002220783C|nr:efflux transporter outer membrane subunit [Porphyrobacter sp. ULC335]UYV15845.1 efflux transporter outer membrane subunit [Porphyrobacter sp. ULC335]